jgi:beta-galactosidase
MSDSSLLVNRREVLLSTASMATLLLIPPASESAAQASTTLPLGRGQRFDLGWRFRREAGDGFEAPNFDDSEWRSVDLPHDWSIEDLPPATDTKAQVVGPFTSAAEGGSFAGFAVGGEGWYRKRFRLDKPAHGRVEILFEGVYMNSDVWMNGQHLGTHVSGYTPFIYDLTPHLAASGYNVLAVRVRNLGANTRWYSGSGIYRHVWLDVLPEQARIGRWGVGVVTRRIADDRAEIEISTRLQDVGDGITLVARVKDDAGRVVHEASMPAATEMKQAITLASPRLWSPGQPTLYAVEMELRRGGSVLDRASTAFGIRIVTFDAEHGMRINGVPTKLHGGCIHHDLGLLGAAAFDAAEERKVRLLKARGFNAVRAAHNPYGPSFLRSCDQQGMLVIAEAFDVWNEPKVPQDYALAFAANWHEDLTATVLSARHHPSIIMWSIGNEIPGRNSPRGVETQWHLTNEVHRLDPSRPVTAAINGFAGRKLAPAEKTARPGAAGVADQASTLFLDVVGYNYKLADYAADHQAFPKRIIYGAESFPQEAAAIWEFTEKSPWLLGDFVWVAMDYLGEAGMAGNAVVAASDRNSPETFGWPWVNSFSGDIDLIGHQKPPSLARDVVWAISPLEIATRPLIAQGMIEVLQPWGWHDELLSWTWPGTEGKPILVSVYTCGDRVALRLNGRPLDIEPIVVTTPKRLEFSVPYEPGLLEVVAFRNGVEIATKQLMTVGAPAAVRLTPERLTGGATRGDISYIGIEVIDGEGRLLPQAVASIELRMSGPAELIAFGSANPRAVGGFQSPTAQTWHGRALAIVRGRGQAGRVTIEARSPGLRIGSAALRLS